MKTFFAKSKGPLSLFKVLFLIRRSFFFLPNHLIFLMGELHGNKVVISG